MKPTLIGGRPVELVCPDDFQVLLLWMRAYMRARRPPKTSEDEEQLPVDELLEQRVILAALGLCVRWLDDMPPNTPPYTGGPVEVYGDQVLASLKRHGVRLVAIWSRAIEAGNLMQAEYYGPTDREVEAQADFSGAEPEPPSDSASRSASSSSAIPSAASS